MRTLMVAAALAGGLLGAVPASAQFIGGGYGGFGDRPDYGGPPLRPPGAPPYDYGRPPPPGYGQPRFAPRYGRGGPVCVTRYGSCWTGRPPGDRCGCDVPGYGFRRGYVE